MTWLNGLAIPWRRLKGIMRSGYQKCVTARAGSWNGEGLEKTDCDYYTAAFKTWEGAVKEAENTTDKGSRVCLGYSVSCTWASFAKPCP